MSITERVSTSYDIIGHPQQASKPVEEGRHYEVLAYTDWADSMIPTVVKWRHGEIDDFTSPEKSRQNRATAIESKRRSCLNCIHFTGDADINCVEGGASEIGDPTRVLTEEDCNAWDAKPFSICEYESVRCPYCGERHKLKAEGMTSLNQHALRCLACLGGFCIPCEC